MDKNKYLICLVKVETEGNTTYEAFLMDFSYIEVCGRGKDVSSSLKDLKKKKNVLIRDYREKGIDLPVPNSSFINVDSIRHQLKHLYIGKKYTAFLVY